MIKSIIFDAYGTLISTGTGSLYASSKILEKVGRLEIDVKEFYVKWKKYHKKHIETQNEFISEEIVFLMDLEQLYIDYNINSDAKIDVKFMIDDVFEKKSLYDLLDILEEK